MDTAAEGMTGDVTETTVGSWFAESEGDAVGEGVNDIDPEELDEDENDEGLAVGWVDG